MKKTMMLAAMLALVAVVAVVPALADDNGLVEFDDCFPFCDDNGDDFGFAGDDFFAGDAGIVQEFEQEAESGDVELSNEVVNTDDNSNVCAPALRFANTGNLQNAQGFAQYGSETGDVEFGGSAFVFEPSLEASCEQSIEQSAVAYGW